MLWIYSTNNIIRPEILHEGIFIDLIGSERHGKHGARCRVDEGATDASLFDHQKRATRMEPGHQDVGSRFPDFGGNLAHHVALAHPQDGGGSPTAGTTTVPQVLSHPTREAFTPQAGDRFLSRPKRFDGHGAQLEPRLEGQLRSHPKHG